MVSHTNLARIVLIRHGPSAHVHSGGAIDRAGVAHWRDAYDAAGIQAACRPPATLVDLAANASDVVASDLPRAVASAERLTAKRPIRLSPLLREAALEIPRSSLRLPLGLWGMLIHIGWSYRLLRGTDATPEDRARAAQAAAWLAELVADGSTALAVTHGVIRRLIAQQLVVLGWMSAGRRGGYRHWSAWSFIHPAMHTGSRPRGDDS
jgi:broad specificity phosphatase PhoE